MDTRAIGGRVRVIESYGSPTFRAAHPSPLPSPRRTGEREKERRRGFSLLELLLAMAMAAMLALSLYTAMNVTIRARRSAVASIEPTRAGAIAVDLVQRDLESATPPGASDSSVSALQGPFYGAHQSVGSGDNDSVEFYAIGADTHTIGAGSDALDPLAEGVRRIRFYVSADGPTPSLVREVTRNLLPASETVAEPEILARGVRSFSLSYYNGTSWQNHWDSTTLEDSVPFAVEITLELGNANPDTPGRSVRRVVPLACAMPIADGLSSFGGVK